MQAVAAAFWTLIALAYLSVLAMYGYIHLWGIAEGGSFVTGVCWVSIAFGGLAMIGCSKDAASLSMMSQLVIVLGFPTSIASVVLGHWAGW